MSNLSFLEIDAGQPDPYDYRFKPDYQERVRRQYQQYRQAAGEGQPLPGDRLLALWNKLSTKTKGIVLAAGAAAVGAVLLSSGVGQRGAGAESQDVTPIVNKNVIKMGIDEGQITEGYPLDPQPGQVYRDNGQLMMIHETLNKELVSIPYSRWSGEQQQAEYQKITGHEFTGRINP